MASFVTNYWIRWWLSWFGHVEGTVILISAVGLCLSLLTRLFILDCKWSGMCVSEVDNYCSLITIAKSSCGEFSKINETNPTFSIKYSSCWSEHSIIESKRLVCLSFFARIYLDRFQVWGYNNSPLTSLGNSFHTASPLEQFAGEMLQCVVRPRRIPNGNEENSAEATYYKQVL